MLFDNDKQYNSNMDEFRFHHPIEVRYGDLDPQGHVNNARFLTFFEQARVSYLIQLGLFSKDQSFLDVGIIIADAHITFLAPVYFGQDVRVGVRVSRVGNKSMSMDYQVTDGANGQELATGSTALVAYDYRLHKTIPVPEEWRKKISQFEHGG
jgi:acyl-CoA thioester hydrolase